MTIISKNWTYTIEGHDFTLLMAPSEDMLTVKTTISMDGHGPMLVLGFKAGILGYSISEMKAHKK